MRELFEILVPRWKPIEEWNDEDRHVFGLALLGLFLFILASMIPY